MHSLLLQEYGKLKHKHALVRSDTLDGQFPSWFTWDVLRHGRTTPRHIYIKRKLVHGHSIGAGFTPEPNARAWFDTAHIIANK